jgi:hypothetical protein
METKMTRLVESLTGGRGEESTRKDVKGSREKGNEESVIGEKIKVKRG